MLQQKQITWVELDIMIIPYPTDVNSTSLSVSLIETKIIAIGEMNHSNRLDKAVIRLKCVPSQTGILRNLLGN